MMKSKIIFFFILIFNLTSFAEEINVVDVRRNITMADDDIVYKDISLNAGTSAGLKKNLVVTVKRKLSVKDASSKAIGEIESKVAQIKIIQVDSKVAIAREYKDIPRDEEPVLEQIGIMAGDRIDLDGSFIDNKPLVYEKKHREPSSVTKVIIENKTSEATPDKPATSEKMTAPTIQSNPQAVTPMPEI